MLTTREAKIKFGQESLKEDKESVNLIKIEMLPMIRRMIAIHDGLVLDLHGEVKSHVKKAIDYVFKKISPDPRNALQDIFSHLQNTELELQTACNIVKNKYLKQDLHDLRDEIFCIYQRLPKETRVPSTSPDTQLTEKSQSPEELKKAMDMAGKKAEETLAEKNPKQAVLLCKLNHWAETTLNYLKSKLETSPVRSGFFSKKPIPYTKQIELIELFKTTLDTISKNDAKLNDITISLVQQMLNQHLGSPLNGANENEIQTLNGLLQKLHSRYSPPKPSSNIIQILRDIGL